MPKRKPVIRVLIIALFFNALTCLLKWFVGVKFHSLAMVADAFHSFSDAGGSVLGWIAVAMADKPSDKNHHYGHSKFEDMASLVISAIIGLTSWELIKAALKRMSDHSGALQPDNPYQVVAIATMMFCMLVNIGISYYERKKARLYKSSILEADAFHTASDVWVSTTVLVSVLLAKLQLSWLDPLVSLLIAAYLIWIAFSLVLKTTKVLSDAAFIDIKRVKTIATSVEGVIGCHHVRTRGLPGQAFVDLHIQVPPDMTTVASHELAHIIEERIKDEITGIHDVLIHTEPYPDNDDTV